jgi:transcriptional regulator with XRE-family HTH domain
MLNLKLRNEIYQQGFSQAEVCRKAEVRPEYLSMAIKGRCLLKPDERQRISKFLGRAECELFPVECHLEKVADKIQGAA